MANYLKSPSEIVRSRRGRLDEMLSSLGDLRCFLLAVLEFLANSLKPDMDVKFQFTHFYSKRILLDSSHRGKAALSTQLWL